MREMEGEPTTLAAFASGCRRDFDDDMIQDDGIGTGREAEIKSNHHILAGRACPLESGLKTVASISVRQRRKPRGFHGRFKLQQKKPKKIYTRGIHAVFYPTRSL